MNDPRNILSHAKSILIEQIMALHGRSVTGISPRQYRTWLESCSLSQLRDTLEELTEFPAPEETTNAIHRNTGEGASTPARGVFTNEVLT